MSHLPPTPPVPCISSTMDREAQRLFTYIQGDAPLSLGVPSPSPTEELRVGTTLFKHIALTPDEVEIMKARIRAYLDDEYCSLRARMDKEFPVDMEGAKTVFTPDLNVIVPNDVIKLTSKDVPSSLYYGFVSEIVACVYNLQHYLFEPCFRDAYNSKVYISIYGQAPSSSSSSLGGGGGGGRGANAHDLRYMYISVMQIAKIRYLYVDCILTLYKNLMKVLELEFLLPRFNEMPEKYETMIHNMMNKGMDIEKEIKALEGDAYTIIEKDAHILMFYRVYILLLTYKMYVDKVITYIAYYIKLWKHIYVYENMENNQGKTQKLHKNMTDILHTFVENIDTVVHLITAKRDVVIIYIHFIQVLIDRYYTDKSIGFERRCRDLYAQDEISPAMDAWYTACSTPKQCLIVDAHCIVSMYKICKSISGIGASSESKLTHFTALVRNEYIYFLDTSDALGMHHFDLDYAFLANIVMSEYAMSHTMPKTHITFAYKHSANSYDYILQCSDIKDTSDDERTDRFTTFSLLEYAKRLLFNLLNVCEFRCETPLVSIELIPNTLYSRISNHDLSCVYIETGSPTSVIDNRSMLLLGFLLQKKFLTFKLAVYTARGLISKFSSVDDKKISITNLILQEQSKGDTVINTGFKSALENMGHLPLNTTPSSRSSAIARAPIEFCVQQTTVQLMESARKYIIKFEFIFRVKIIGNNTEKKPRAQDEMHIDGSDLSSSSSSSSSKLEIRGLRKSKLLNL